MFAVLYYRPRNYYINKCMHERERIITNLSQTDGCTFPYDVTDGARFLPHRGLEFFGLFPVCVDLGIDFFLLGN